MTLLGGMWQHWLFCEISYHNFLSKIFLWVFFHLLTALYTCSSEPSRYSSILLIRSVIVICSSLQLSRMPQPYQCQLPCRGHFVPLSELSSLQCCPRTCSPVRKLTLHAWWYTASAAGRSWAYSSLPNTILDHS